MTDLQFIEILEKWKRDEIGIETVLDAADVYSLADNGAKPIVSGALPFVHSVIESRIKHFESIYHTYEANELKQALSTIQRLVPPIMFEVVGGNDR